MAKLNRVKSTRKVSVVVSNPGFIMEQLRSMQGQIDELKKGGLVKSEDDSVQPGFAPRELADERRRGETVIERKKWAVYYELHGCIRCNRKKRPHTGGGLCPTCRSRIHERLKVILAELERDAESKNDFSPDQR